MIGITFIASLAQARKFTQGGNKRLTSGMSKGLLKTLEMIERHHKQKEFQAGSKDTPSHPTKLTHRTRALSRSYRGKIDKKNLILRYGSSLLYAPVHEKGATIAAKTAPYLVFYVPGVGVRRAKKVTIPPRPTLQRTLDRVLGKRKGIAQVIDSGMKELDRA